MGVAEVLPRLPNLLRRIRETGDAVAAAAPDALVTIDSPDFTLRVARRARRLRPGLRVIHYVAPSVWAWRPGRAAKMAEVVDHVLALLPFEPPYMQAAGMTCDFVGHPVAAERQASAGRGGVAAGRARDRAGPAGAGAAAGLAARRGDAARAGLRRGGAAAPGADAGARGDRAGGAGGGGSARRERCRPDDAGWPHVLDPRGFAAPAWEARKRAAFAAADVALAASGTVSLELAAAGTPMVIGYDANPLTVWIAKRLVRVETATLVNLVTGTRAVPEFLVERLHAGADRAGGRGAARRAGGGGGAAGGGGGGDAPPRARRRAAGAPRGAVGARGAQPVTLSGPRHRRSRARSGRCRAGAAGRS